MQQMSRNAVLAVIAFISVAIAFAGCGAGNHGLPATPAPVTQSATVDGQYDLLLTSMNGHGTTYIYTRFAQTGTSFTGSGDTLVCPANDVSRCQGQDASGLVITPSGTVGGANVTIIISLPSAAPDTVTMTGTATGTNFTGTYTDSLGDAGSWTASAAGPLNGNYSGTFNSTSNPLPIAPTILMTLSEDASFHLTGTAMIMGSPCIGSLALSGQAIGGAFSLIDATSKMRIIALPTGSDFSFTYNFDPTAPSCAADFGRGMVTNQDPWGY
jgi:hypothetical protein